MPIAMILSLLIAQQPLPLVMEMDVSPETDAGRSQVALRAVEMCAGRYPQLGRYTFEGEARSNADAGRFVYRGELTCLDRPPATDPGAPLPADWQPAPSDEAAARTATMAFFAAVDRNDVSAWEAMMTPSYRGTGTTDERVARLAQFHREAGAPGHHRIIRTTWYVNPPGVPPGAYVAVDFDRSYAGLSVSCGYVAWHRQANGRLLLVREESGNAPRVEGMSSEQRAEIRRQLRCRD